MGIFAGKKLLMLGSNIASIDIIEYAKSEGAYVIVCDYLPIEQSEAKKHADEVWMISTVDTDNLIKRIKEYKIDGVFCGVSEVNLQAVQEVAEHTGLPCYFTKNQWDLCENKSTFKNLCKKYQVPIAEEYELSDNPTEGEIKELPFPVIIKPVDLCASRGVHICYNERDFLVGYKDAFEKSPSHNVIVEQYLTGDEISATYTFVDGKCKLSMLSQMYYNIEQVGFAPLPDAYIYPSKYLDKFLASVNTQIMEMLKSIGLKNGSVFITGIASDNGFAFFEAGLRLAGTAPYRFVSLINGINIMQLMTEFAINGTIIDASLIEREDPMLKGKKCCIYSLMNKGGKIKKICGIERVSELPGIIYVTVQRKEGEIVLNDGTLGHINIRFYIVKDSIDEIRDTIYQIQNFVDVTDENGNSMLMKSNITEIL